MLKKQTIFSNKRNNNLFIVEAMLEYFISLLFTGAYFAKITSYVGMSDALTGILTSFVTLGSTFQVIALFLHNKVPVKRWITVLHLINQLCFAFIYVVPVIKVSKTIKTIIFIVLLLVAYLFHNVVNSPKISWYMSFVENKKRGVFTANKEIVSLIGGIIFTYAIGFVIDGFEAIGEIETAFIIASIVLFILAIGHTIVLLFTQEKPTENFHKEPMKVVFKTVLTNKNILKVIGFFCISTIASSFCTPFYGTFQNKELGLSITYITTIIMISNIARLLLTKFFGKLADKKSFIFVTLITGIMVMLSYSVVIFATPANGMIIFAIYYLLTNVAQCGVSSASINLIYDEIDPSLRTDAYAIKNAIIGVVGFTTTTLVAPLVEYIQSNNGITLFGANLYAQQFISIIATIIKLISLFYIFIFWKIKPKKKKD